MVDIMRNLCAESKKFGILIFLENVLLLLLSNLIYLFFGSKGLLENLFGLMTFFFI